jgi:Protein of unknown function (DUF760)
MIKAAGAEDESKQSSPHSPKAVRLIFVFFVGDLMEMENPINPVEQTFESAAPAVENQLWQYVSKMDGATIAQISQPTSTEVMDVMERHIVAMLGALPSHQFDVTITTNRENLGRMMAAAMMHGYFLKTAENRLAIEKSLLAVSDLVG